VVLFPSGRFVSPGVKSLPRGALQIAVHWLLAAFCLAGAGLAQSLPSSPFSVIDEAEAPPALVRSVRIVPAADGPAVEIITTRPMVPIITRLTGPARLVIDLPKSYLPERQKIAFRDEEISGVRISQFQKNPPIVRMVVDLTKPCGFGWDEAGNRLMIRLRPEQPNVEPANSAQSNPGEAASPAFTEGIAPVSSVEGVVSGAVLPASNRFAASSSVTAGADTAIVKLARGGEVRVCPGTTVSVTSSQNGGDLMLGMSTGALEAHYLLNASTDSVLTPDFRIFLPGPGRFDYAISADSRGNTCVRALPGNTAVAMVSEVMGKGVYQVKPSEQVVFHAGQLALLDANAPADCGCPASSVPVMRVAAPQPANSGLASLASPPVVSASGALPASPAVSETGSATPVTASLPPSKPEEIHVQVEAPLVFRASDSQPTGAEPVEVKPASPGDSGPPQVADASPTVVPSGSEPAARPAHRGFFGKVKSVLATMFH
jgi:hypothetical protein